MPAPDPIRILYMEDDRGTARRVQKRLEQAGYIVDLAYDGEDGLAMYAAGAYDIVAVDHAMPVREGLEVIRILASRGPLPPTIMVTGVGDEAVAVEAMKLGAGDYIVKDVDGGFLELLPAVIERALSRHRMSEAKRRAEEAQRLAARQWRDTFDAIKDMVIVCDPEHRLVRANRAARDVVQDRDVVGMPCHKLIHGTDAPPPGCPARQIFRTGEAVHAQIQEPHLGGRWFDLHAYPINDDTGATVQMVHVLRDITERKRAEKELRQTLAELERFNRLAVGRELRMIELKREVNEMARRAGLPPPYDLAFAKAGTADGDMGEATR